MGRGLIEETRGYEILTFLSSAPFFFSFFFKKLRFSVLAFPRWVSMHVGMAGWGAAGDSECGTS